MEALDRNKLLISKIDAARRQLDCAIELWFLEKDEVSAHALAGAAYQVIHDICMAKGAGELLYDSAVVKDEYRKEFNDQINAARNFIKHADRDPDPDSVIELIPFGTFVFMLFAVSGLRKLRQPTSPHMALFWTWLLLHHAEYFSAGLIAELEASGPKGDLMAAAALSRPEFYKLASKLAVLAA